MRTLYDETFTSLNISTEQELARFVVTDQNVAIIVMINLDSLSGDGGEYAARLTIDDRLVVPDRKVIIGSGIDSVSFQSRDIALYQDGILKINLQGTTGDTNVNGRLVIIDTSPVTVEEVSALVDGITPEIIEAVKTAIAGLDISVRPETKVFGPCKRTVVSMPQVKRC